MSASSESRYKVGMHRLMRRFHRLRCASARALIVLIASMITVHGHAAVSSAQRRTELPAQAFRRILAESSPRIGSRVRLFSIRDQPGEDISSFEFIGIVHPDSGRSICDNEAVAVVAVDLAVRRLLPAVLQHMGEESMSHILRGLSPMHDGNEAASAAATVRNVAKQLRTSSRAARMLSASTRNISGGMYALGRHRAAPQSFVFESVASLIRVLARKPELDRFVLDYATDVFDVLGPAIQRKERECDGASGIVVRRASTR